MKGGDLSHHNHELQGLHDWEMEMQPKTNRNYPFVVLLLAKMDRIQKNTHNVWSSSKYHNHILVSRAYCVPLS